MSDKSLAIPETPPESLRTEIIESQKAQADYLKWKLISVGAIGGLTLAPNSETAQAGTIAQRLLVCLVPLLCSYVDLISIHLMIRIIAIGAYLRERGDKYETYTFTLRERSGKSPYIFEATALHGSSLVFDAIIIIVGFASISTNQFLPISVSIAYIVSGTFGFFLTIILFLLYNSRQKEVISHAKEIIHTICQDKGYERD